MEKIKFQGPQDYVDVLGRGRHYKGKTKEYPNDLVEELLEDERFSRVKAEAKAKTEKKG